MSEPEDTRAGCTPMPAAAAHFVADPSDYHRDGVSYNAVKGHADKIFPEGPRPFIGIHNAASSDYAAFGSHGFTVVNQAYRDLTTLTDVLACAPTGMKYQFPFRKYNAGTANPQGCPKQPGDPSLCGGYYAMCKAGKELRQGIHTTFNELKKSFDFLSNLVNSNPTANDTVMAWATKIDDGFGNRSYCGAELGDYCTYARAMFPYMSQKDPRSRGVTDLPKPAFGWDQKLDADLNGLGGGTGGWQNIVKECTSQLYWNDDSNQGANGRTRMYFSRMSFAQRISRTPRISAYARSKNGNGPLGNIVRPTIPLLWVTGDKPNGHTGDSTAQRVAWKRANRVCDIISMLCSGAHGYMYFSVVRKHFLIDSYDHDINDLNVLTKTLTDAHVIEAFLWSKKLTDVTKTALTPTKYMYVEEAQNDLNGRQKIGGCGTVGSPAGGSDVARSGGHMFDAKGTNICNSHGQHMSSTYIDDHIAWANLQYKGARFLVVTNLMPDKKILEFYKNGVGSNSPIPGTNGLANYSIKSRFNLPRIDYKGLKCIDILTGKNAATNHEFSASAHTITVTLAPAESRIYKFVPDDGYCGGDVALPPTPATHITRHPANVSLKVGDALHTFHTDFTPASAKVQWQFQNLAGGVVWRNIPGATGKSYKMTSNSGHTELAQNGDEFRAAITNTGHPVAYSHTAHLRVSSVAVVIPPTTGHGCIQLHIGGGWHKAKQLYVHAAGKWHAAKNLNYHAAGGWKHCSPADTGIVVTHQPANIHTQAGAALQHTSVAFTPAEAHVQWEWRHPTVGSTHWAAVPGATGKTYTMHNAGTGKVTQGQIGDEYRAHITLTGHPDVYSHTSLVVDTAHHPKPTVSHVSDQSAHVGGRVTFSATVSGASSMQWRYRVNAHSPWHNIAGRTGNSHQTDSLTLSHNGHQYQLVAHNPQGDTASNIATLHVTAVAVKPTVSVLANQTLTAGDRIHLKVVGHNYTNLYWQKDINDGHGMVKIPHATTAAWNPPQPVTVAHSGWKYQAVLTGPGGTVKSHAAVITVKAKVIPKPVISFMEDMHIPYGSVFVLSPHVTGATSYQWYYRFASASSWSVWPGRNVARASGTFDHPDMEGMLYHLVATGPGGVTVSNSVRLNKA